MLTSSKYTTIASFCPSVTPRLSPERRVTPLNGAHEVVRVAGDDLDSQFSFSWTPRFRAHRTVRRIHPGIPRTRTIGCIRRGKSVGNGARCSIDMVCDRLGERP